MIDEKALSAMLLDQVGSPCFCVISLQKNLEMLPSVKSAPAGYTWSVDEQRRKTTYTSMQLTPTSPVPRGSACKQQRETLPTTPSRCMQRRIIRSQYGKNVMRGMFILGFVTSDESE